METSVFVTGTDTGVGKTHVALELMQQARQCGLRVAGYKPIASGCELIDGAWKNSDALALQQASSMELDYALINPYAFEPPIAPHIAAAEQGVKIDSQRLLDNYRQLQQLADVLIVEGAGGCLVPIDEQQTMLDLAKTLALPVTLVIAVRLGCINHALLSVDAIRSKGLQLQSLVFNHCQPQPAERSAEIIKTIKRFSGCDEAVVMDYDEPSA